MAAKLHPISDIDITQYGPRAGGQVDLLLMAADRVDFFGSCCCSIRWARGRAQRRPRVPGPRGRPRRLVLILAISCSRW